jgi:hypothetical protein
VCGARVLSECLCVALSDSSPATDIVAKAAQAGDAVEKALCILPQKRAFEKEIPCMVRDLLFLSLHKRDCLY